MIFVQIVLGGITRLTGSGLSITTWDIVTGTIPPMNQQEWQAEFELYKITPQYQKINAGMSVKEFKYIYFWEYIHRLWARSIGIVFILPFILFSIKGWLNHELYKQLGVAVLLGVIVAAFGWIMVASGLVDRPWVNAYKLTVHLNLALLLYAWLFWVAVGNVKATIPSQGFGITLNALTTTLVVQLILGGLMSGMKAGLYYPTWPDMHGEFFPVVLLDPEIWTITSFMEYERGLVPGLVQFLHRICAYIVLILSFVLYWKARRRGISDDGKITIGIVLLCVIVQVGLGIATVINCIGIIPIGFGVAHQMFAILLLSSLLFMHKKILR